MTTTTRTAAADMYAAIAKALNLDTRTINFHIVNGQDMSGGLVFDADDLSRSDAWTDLAEACSLDRYVSCDVVSYMLGSGETDAASIADVETLDRFRQADPEIWDAMLWEYADEIINVDNLSAENPFYDDDDETEDE